MKFIVIAGFVDFSKFCVLLGCVLEFLCFPSPVDEIDNTSNKHNNNCQNNANDNRFVVSIRLSIAEAV